jgi:hypothetical protein
MKGFSVTKLDGIQEYHLAEDIAAILYLQKNDFIDLSD